MASRYEGGAGWGNDYSSWVPYGPSRTPRGIRWLDLTPRQGVVAEAIHRDWGEAKVSQYTGQIYVGYYPAIEQIANSFPIKNSRGSVAPDRRIAYLGQTPFDVDIDPSATVDFTTRVDEVTYHEFIELNEVGKLTQGFMDRFYDNRSHYGGIVLDIQVEFSSDGLKITARTAESREGLEYAARLPVEPEVFAVIFCALESPRRNRHGDLSPASNLRRYPGGEDRSSSSVVERLARARQRSLEELGRQPPACWDTPQIQTAASDGAGRREIRYGKTARWQAAENKADSGPKSTVARKAGQKKKKEAEKKQKGRGKKK